MLDSMFSSARISWDKPFASVLLSSKARAQSFTSFIHSDTRNLRMRECFRLVRDCSGRTGLRILGILACDGVRARVSRFFMLRSIAALKRACVFFRKAYKWSR